MEKRREGEQEEVGQQLQLAAVAALAKARERVPGSLLKFSDLWMSNFVVYLARFAASDGSTGVIRLDRRVVVAELILQRLPARKIRRPGSPVPRLHGGGARRFHQLGAHPRRSPPLPASGAGLSSAGLGCARQVPEGGHPATEQKAGVRQGGEAQEGSRRAAAAEQQTQTSITNAAAGVSVEAATDASDGVSSSMDDSDAVAASAGARLSLLSPVVPLGLARSQPDDLWPRWRLRCGRNGSGLTPHAPN
jgi:hypothetical protein